MKVQTLAVLLGPSVGVFVILFVPVYLTADPGGVWPPVFVALFTAVPMAVAAFAMAVVFLLCRWVMRLWHKS